MQSKSSLTEKILLKTCLPIKESVTAIVSEINANCSQKINFIEDLKNKARPYIEKLKKNKIFRTTNPLENNNNNININQEEQEIQNPSEIKRLNNNNINNNMDNINGATFLQSK